MTTTAATRPTPADHRDGSQSGDPAGDRGGRPAGRRGGGLTARHHLGVVAAIATVLASAPLLTIFERWTWLGQSVLAVAAVAVTAAGARALRVPAAGQVLAMLVALLLALTILFPSGDEFFLLPTAATFEHFQALLAGVPEFVSTETLPAANHDGLLLLTVLGVGLVAVTVDVLAVSLRRPALAGLPMLAIYSVPVGVNPDSVHAATFMIAVAGFLWLVATDHLQRVRTFGHRFTGEGRNIPAWEASPLAAVGRRLAVVTTLVAVAIPVVVPGPSGGLVERFGSGFQGSGEGGSGSVSSVNLFAQLNGLLNRDSTIDLLRVSTNDPDPFYLRVGTADQITEQGFGHRDPRGRSATDRLPNPGIPPPAGVTQHRFNASIEVLGWDLNRLPTYSHPISLDDAAGDWRYDPDQQVIFSPDTRASGISYELEYVRPEFDPDALRQARPLPAGHEIRQEYTEVIEEPQVDALVAEVVRGAETPYDQALAILAHFSTRNGFRYSLETGAETTGSAIVDFLIVNQAGFCVQYAAAMTWMARAAGLPARVAIGLTRGSQQTDGSYLLTNHHLHAWSEVYFLGFGWVPFDPTPSTGVRGSATRSWAPDPNAPPEQDSATGSSGSGATPLPPGDGPQDGPAQLDETVGGAVGGLGEESGPAWGRWLFAGALIVLMLLLAPAARRLQLRRRRISHRGARVGNPTPAPAAGGVTSADPAATGRYRAHAAWDELVDTMVDFQLPLDPAETPRSAAERLVRECLTHHPPAVDTDSRPVAGARLLARAEERARYALAPGSVDGLAAAVRAVRRAVATRSGRWTRLRAVVLPPSTLARWRTATSDGFARVALISGRLGAALSKLSPRRLLRTS